MGNELQKLLLDFRKNNGLSQGDAAKIIGIGYTQLNGLETGRITKVSGHTYKKLSIALKVSISDLRKMLGD